MAVGGGRASEAERLRPYVASLALTWLRDTPESTWREVDGSLVFVDISGFTRLTERLADRGKGGAEEMSDILDATFGELLWVAYAYGAQLVKWGGDAVLLLFTGDDHAARACRSAYEMRATMRRVGQLKTSAGSVTLRMSVGINSGVFHFFLVGALHHELIITGPGATEAARIEGIAEAGEIGISPATAALLDPAVVGVEKEPGVLLLRRAPKIAETPRRSPLDLGGIDVASCLTAPTHEHLLAGATDGEHRQISVAFVEFKQTDELLAAQGPGALAAALHHVVSATQEACARHGVTFWETDISPNGGKIMLVGGAPRSTDDDAGAMLATARDLMDAGGALPVRIGVNYGRVFSGDFGPDYRRALSVKGDAVNLAARVMGKSSAGEIYATETILEHSRLAFDAEVLEPFMVKGKLRPVQAYRLGRVLQAGVGSVEDDLPLLGREQEMNVLRHALDAARAGTGSLVEVVGEPGIGKSRLLLEVRREASDLRQVAAICDAYHSSTPYAPFRSLLRQLINVAYDADSATAGTALIAAVRREATQLADWLPLLAVVADADVPATDAATALDEKFRKTRLEKATSDFLAALLAAPSLLVFEDVHLADDASADLLAHLAGEESTRPWALVVTRRTTTGGFSAPADLGHTRIDLLPLDELSAGALLASASDESPLRPHEMELLSERAQGNPLFLLQLVEAVRRSGSVDELPDSVEGVITARIDRLPPVERRLLRTAAVLGVRFERRVLDAVLATDGNRFSSRHLGEFLESTGEGMLAFRHALVRDTAYEGLPFTRRKALHGRAGDALESLYADRTDERADLLSLHFLNAERFEKAWSFGQLAGDRARMAGANSEAARFYEQALFAGRQRRVPGRDTAAVYERLGDSRFRLNDFSEAGEAYRSARRHYGDSRCDVARINLRSAEVADRAGRYRVALRWTTAARRLLEGVDDSKAGALRAHTSAFAGLIRYRQGHHREAVRLCLRAIAEAEVSDARPALAAALVHLDFSQMMLGQGDGSSVRRGLDIWRELGDSWQESRAHTTLGVRAYFSGQWDDALVHYENARIAAERSGDAFMALIAEANTAEILSDQGRLDEAEPRIRSALRSWRAMGHESQEAFGLILLGRVKARRGHFSAALEDYAAAKDLVRRHGELAAVLEVDAVIAECLLWQGDTHGAANQAEQAIQGTHSLPGTEALLPLLLRVQGLTLARFGEPSAGLTAIHESLDVGRRRKAMHEVLWSLDALAMVEATVGGLAGRNPECDAIAQRLGIVQIPPQQALALSPPAAIH